MSTTIPSGKDIKRKWFVLDASGKTLGRLATQAASVLAGKLNPLYTPTSIWAITSSSSMPKKSC